MSDKEILKRFGKYLLLDHLVDGGMAKICRARYLGEQADKIVAIKMVQPKFSEDEAFKKMFMDEIKVTFGLIHPNVAQTYDYGIEEGQLYTAMEYVDGRNLKQYLDKLKERRFVFPVEISVYIISQVCQGLHYSHTFADKLSGKKTCIIHRDISPHNIMLTYDGAIKVIDFGIAKADSNPDSTQAGVIKGKLSYLAPEYLEGKRLDARYDEFAVGITLWEMLCSRKLFQAPNDIAVLKKIQVCKVPPPSSINPNVPKELDEIVLKALSRDREKRYPDCDQLNRALIKFLYSTYPDFNSTDLAYFAKELFKEDIKEDRKHLQEFGKIDLKPYLAEMNAPVKANVESIPHQHQENSEIRRTEKVVLDFGFDDDKSKSKKILTTSTTDTKFAKGQTGPIVMDQTMKIKKLQPAEVRKVSSTSSTKGTGEFTKSRLILKEKLETKKSSPLVSILAASLFIAAIVGYGHISGKFQIVKEINKIVKISKPISDIRAPSSEANTEVVEDKVGKVIIENLGELDPMPKFYIDGVMVRPSLLGEIELPLAKTALLRVERVGFKHYVVNVGVTKEEPRMQITIPDTEVQHYAYLMMSRPCITGVITFEMFGEPRRETLPFESGGIKIPISKTEFLAFTKANGDDIEKRVTFLAEHENESIDLCEFVY